MLLWLSNAVIRSDKQTPSDDPAEARERMIEGFACLQGRRLAATADFDLSVHALGTTSIHHLIRVSAQAQVLGARVRLMSAEGAGAAAAAAEWSRRTIRSAIGFIGSTTNASSCFQSRMLPGNGVPATHQQNLAGREQTTYRAIARRKNSIAGDFMRRWRRRNAIDDLAR